MRVQNSLALISPHTCTQIFPYPLTLSFPWSRTRKDFDCERRNECELPPRIPTRPQERSNSFCATGDVLFGLCLFLACAAFAMERASLSDDRYTNFAHAIIHKPLGLTYIAQVVSFSHTPLPLCCWKLGGSLASVDARKNVCGAYVLRTNSGRCRSLCIGNPPRFSKDRKSIHFLMRNSG